MMRDRTTVADNQGQEAHSEATEQWRNTRMREAKKKNLAAWSSGHREATCQVLISEIKARQLQKMARNEALFENQDYLSCTRQVPTV